MSKHVMNFNTNNFKKKIQQLQSHKEEAAEEAIMVASVIVNRELNEFFAKGNHGKTGLAQASLEKNPKLENDGGKISIKLGFNSTEPHGLAAIFWTRGSYLMDGSPRIQPNPFIKEAFQSKEARKALNGVLKHYLEKYGNGK